MDALRDGEVLMRRLTDEVRSCSRASSDDGASQPVIASAMAMPDIDRQIRRETRRRIAAMASTPTPILRGALFLL
jgi:hypothetical protein